MLEELLLYKELHTRIPCWERTATFSAKYFNYLLIIIIAIN